MGVGNAAWNHRRRDAARDVVSWNNRRRGQRCIVLVGRRSCGVGHRSIALPVDTGPPARGRPKEAPKTAKNTRLGRADPFAEVYCWNNCAARKPALRLHARLVSAPNFRQRDGTPPREGADIADNAANPALERRKPANQSRCRVSVVVVDFVVFDIPL